MKAYLLTTGILFGLITVAHVWRLCVETRLMTDIAYHLLTLLAAGLCVWAFRLLKKSSAGGSGEAPAPRDT